MSDTKFTKGPWRIDGLDKNGQRQILAESGELVAVLAHECIVSREAEMEANAALVAVAPDLLATLELAKHKIEETLAGQYPNGEALRAALRVIGKTISEAKGEP